MRSFVLPLLALAAVACSSSDAATSSSGSPTPTTAPTTTSPGPSTPPTTSDPGDGGAPSSTSDGGNTTPPSDGGGDINTNPTAPTNITRACNGSSATMEHYSQPVSPAVNGVSFLSNWSAEPLAGGFQGIQAVDPCRYQLDPKFSTWHGKPATRIEVNPGDDPLNLGTERAEALSMQTSAGAEIIESAPSGTQYFAFSWYFPTNWDATFLKGDGDSWSFITQFHGSSDVAGGLAIGRRTTTDKQHLWYDLGSTGEAAFSDGGEITLGQWIDLVMEVDFKAGHLTMYRRNQGQTKFASVIDVAYPDAASVAGIYFKQGLYRGPDVNGRTDVFWIGQTARGTSFASVESATFGTSDGF